MRANIQAVSLKIQTLKSQNAMAEAMKGVTKAMQNMNKYKSTFFLLHFIALISLFCIITNY
jgi:phage shock protein A